MFKTKLKKCYLLSLFVSILFIMIYLCRSNEKIIIIRLPCAPSHDENKYETVVSTISTTILPNLTDTDANKINLDKLKSLEKEPWAKGINNGYYKPYNVTFNYSFAIIIPYRNRSSHLVQFLEIMHPYLQNQSAEYQIYVIEQNNENIFNKGALMNAGFHYISRLPNNTFNCYIFHDVDVLPLVPNITYRCSKNPFHLGSYVNVFDFKILYRIVGAILSVTSKQYIALNGFSNWYEGWGAEDNDMYERILEVYKNIDRPPQNHRFYMIKHESDNGNPPNEQRRQILASALKRYKNDGLNTIKYLDPQIITKYKLITWLQFDFPKSDFFRNMKT